MIISHKYKFIFIKTTKVGGTSLELLLSHLCDDNDVVTPFWQEEENHHPRNYKGYFNVLDELAFRVKRVKKLKNSGINNTMSDFLYRNKYFENIPAWQLKQRVSSKIWNNYFVFTIERNPWDKCISRYFHSKNIYENKYKKPLSFESWFDYFLTRLKNPHLTRAWGSEAPYNYPRYADPWTDELLVNHICRYENLNEELEIIFNKLGMPFENFGNYRAKGKYRIKREHYSEIIKEPYIDKIRAVFYKEIKLMEYEF
jgi:hypothetical protein